MILIIINPELFIGFAKKKKWKPHELMLHYIDKNKKRIVSKPEKG